MYRDLYADLPPTARWDDFKRLPVLTPARLRTTPLSEQVDALDDVLRSQTAYALQSAVTPRALVLDADDTGAEFDRTRAAFSLLGIRKGERVALVTPPHQRYPASETADTLGYFAIEAHVVVALDPATLARSLDVLAPDRTILFGVSPPNRRTGTVTTRLPGGDEPDMYVVPEAGIVAVRPAGGEPYRVLSRFFLIESEPSGALLLTALLRYHQPLIRYQLRDRGRLERGRLWLSEVVP